MIRLHQPELWLILAALVCCAAQVTSGTEAVRLSEDPMLRDLFSGDPSQLTKLTSCLDSVFKLRQAYEVLYSVKSIYNDFLTSRTDQLTDFEQKLLIFCQDPLPISSSSVNAYLRHPVNSHKFVAFTARVMNPRLSELISGHSGVKMLMRQLISNAGCWLNEESVTDSIENLLVIKAFYNITAEDFAQGNFLGRKAEAGFSEPELMELLLQLNRQFDPVEVVEMAEYMRLHRRDEVRSLGEQPLRSVYRILGKAYYQMKQFDMAVQVLQEYKTYVASSGTQQSQSGIKGIDSDLAYIAANRRGEPKDFAEESATSPTSLERVFDVSLRDGREDYRRYRSLCGGGGGGGGGVPEGWAANVSSNPLLICENWRPYNGWYQIRKEILTLDPLIVQYRDVFTRGENFTDNLMQEAEKRIFEAPPEDFGEIEKHNRLTKVRMHAFKEEVRPFDSNATRSIIDRLEFVTRMDASTHGSSLEKYIDMTNYGHGIRNLPHVTSKLPELFFNSMATAIFYPVDDVIGGELIFPQKYVKIPIQRTDLYLWYNYMPTYYADRKAQLHYVCPIVYGDKWTARVTLGHSRCSQDQELMVESWLPGTTLARRQSMARNWTVLIRPKKSLSIGNKTEGYNVTVTLGSDMNSTDDEALLKANSTESPQRVHLDRNDSKADQKADQTEGSPDEEIVESTDPGNEKDDADDSEAD